MQLFSPARGAALAHLVPTLVGLSALVHAPLGAQDFAEVRKVGPLPGTDRATVVAMADLDADGDADAILGTASGSRLFVNRSDGRFIDRSIDLPAAMGHVVDVAIGDVDGDGNPDVVIAHDRGADQVFFNDGSARFTERTSMEAAYGAGATTCLELADLDGDGFLDLCCGSSWTASGFSRFFLNDGGGGFFDPGNSRLPDHTFSVRAVDVESDGDADLVLATANGVRLWINGGGGSFTDASARLTPQPGSARRVTVLDLQNDGTPDLGFVVAPGRTVLYRNDGSGSFTDVTATTLPPAGGTTVTALVAVDFDRDGDVDLHELARGTGADRLLRNTGNGVFVDATRALEFVEPEFDAVAAAWTDLDGDRDADAVFAGEADDARPWFNVGGGRLVDSAPAMLPAEFAATEAVAHGDIDADGDIDLIAADASAPMRVLVNDGRGRFRDEAVTRMPLGTSFHTLAIELVDVDGDTDLDLVHGEGMLINDGSGRFANAAPSRLPLDQFVVGAIASGDFDGDGDQDLLFGKRLDQTRLYLNDGTGNFSDATINLPIDIEDTRAIAVGDVDGDGDLDAILGNEFTTVPPQTGANVLWLNDGSGVFTEAPGQVPPGRDPTHDLLLVDVDADQDLDLFVADYWAPSAGNGPKLFFNDGTGRFSARAGAIPPFQQMTHSVAAGDIDLDGDVDLVLGNTLDIRAGAGQSPQDRVLINDGSGFFTDATTAWLTTGEELARAVLLFDADDDGDVDMFVANHDNGSGLRDAGRDRLLFNRTRHLAAPEAARPGRSYVFEIARPTPAPSAIALVFLALSPAQIPAAPFGVLGVDPSTAVTLSPVFFPPGGREVTGTLPIPPIGSLAGVSFWVQAALIDPSAPIGEWHLTATIEEGVY